MIVRRPDGPDLEFGQFTFKRLVDTDEGRKLVPVSTNLDHPAIPLGHGDEVEGIARLIAVVEE